MFHSSKPVTTADYACGMTMGVLDQIQHETMAVLSELLVRGQRVALVDFPNHENSGDALIFLGQLRYLERLGVRVDYVADGSRYNPVHLRTLVPTGPILIQGGGNFGDRWKYMQALRERVITDFPDRQIIQLPQGIDFQEGPGLNQAQAVLNAHPDLTLLIRDHAGEKRARELFPNANVFYCPDMAFGFGRVTDGHGRLDAVVLRRNDSESLEGTERFEMRSAESHIDLDWGLTGPRKVIDRMLHIPGAVTKRFPALAIPLHPLQRRVYSAIARNNVRHAVTILSKGRLVVTNRLHATVLAALMDKPVVAMDNANGKISAIIGDYLGRMPGVQFARSVKEARDLIDTLNAGQTRG
jgi:exopolysaccharide biosynthesis predicted pyruvyltransferase EpsI